MPIFVKKKERNNNMDTKYVFSYVGQFFCLIHGKYYVLNVFPSRCHN